jgi:glycosyltransferase involved in cell wall biosynthesis
VKHAAGLISCIVPVFNGERYIRETLESIFGQTYSPLEVIVADDGSTDNTRDAVVGFGTRVAYLHQANAGPAAARNLGLAAARGEFIAFLDADDLWHAEKLQRQMDLFAERPELDYCVTHVQNFWEPEMEAEARRLRDHRRSRPLPGYSTQTMLSRHSLFDAIGPFDATLGHSDDTEWFLRANESGAIGALHPDVLAFRRLHPANRSRIQAKTSRDEYLQLIKNSLDRRRQDNEAVQPYAFPSAPEGDD